MPREIPQDIVRRILDARLHLEANLDQTLPISVLAAISKLSRFHFQRTFRKVVGETVGQHILRLRIQRAALWLKCSQTPITEIARNTGYGTLAGFSHGFQKRYGLSPSSYREQRTIRPFVRLPDEAAIPPDPDALARCPLTVSIEDAAPQTLAIMRFVGPTERMPTIWPKMLHWMRRRGLSTKTSTFLGIHHDHWDVANPETYRYDAAIVVDPDFRSDDEVTLFRQPGGQIATTYFRGSLRRFDERWRQLTTQWLPFSGYQFREPFVYDSYPASLMSDSILNSLLRTLRGIQATLTIPICSNTTLSATDSRLAILSNEAITTPDGTL